MNIGNIQAVSDWLNADVINKNELTSLFIDHNTGGNVYDLTITGEQDRYLRLVGQTSGKTYNICLAQILGDDMKETVLWTNSGNTNPNTITLNDDWTNYKFIFISAIASGSDKNYALSNIEDVDFIQEMFTSLDNLHLQASDDGNYIAYDITDSTTLTYASNNRTVIYKISGYK